MRNGVEISLKKAKKHKNRIPKKTVEQRENCGIPERKAQKQNRNRTFFKVSSTSAEVSMRRKQSYFFSSFGD